jgi:hypothetical protein
MMELLFSMNLSECPDDVLVWVICDNYKRYKVAKHCSCCGLWSDEDGNVVENVTDWKPYEKPIVSRAHVELDKIINAWLDENYDLNHKKNSVKKHLKVDEVSECDDLELKKRYWAYLSRGEIMQ